MILLSHRQPGNLIGRAVSSHLALIMSLSISITGMCSAQSDSVRPDQTVFRVVGGDGWAALHAAGHVLVSPAEWNTGDWILAGGVVAATGVSFMADKSVLDLMERNHSSFNDEATNIAVEYGSGTVAIGVPAALYVTGLLLKERWLRETGLLAGTTMIIASAGTTLGKVVIGRARPYSGLGHSRFRPFTGQDEFMSFPSGHTTAAFALSAALAARIKNPWASVGLYGVAAGAAVSRMYTREHWLSDVVFSAAYSTAVAHSVVQWFEKDDPAAEGSFSLVPTGNGIRVLWLW